MQVQKFRHQQKQGEPKFERLKKVYEEAKQKQRTTEACRCIPDAERNRQAATDAAIEEQLHAQCSFRSQGTYLQGLVSQINACETGNQKRYATDLHPCIDIAPQSVSVMISGLVSLSNREDYSFGCVESFTYSRHLQYHNNGAGRMRFGSLRTGSRA